MIRTLVLQHLPTATPEGTITTQILVLQHLPTATPGGTITTLILVLQHLPTAIQGAVAMNLVLNLGHHRLVLVETAMNPNQNLETIAEALPEETVIIHVPNQDHPHPVTHHQEVTAMNQNPSLAVTVGI